MITSGSYNFQDTATSDILIQEAYERCGVVGSVITGLQADSAKRSLNFMLSDWTNRGLNLSTVQTAMIDLVSGQASYNLPKNLTRLLEVTGAQIIRQLIGTPFSSAGGVAANAFDGNPLTACTQTSPNGYIYFDYGLLPEGIWYVGMKSFVTATYNLVFEYSFDDVTWIPVGSAGSQEYLAGKTQWFVITSPVRARYIRARETGGATLNVAELFFSTPYSSRLLVQISRAEYAAIPNKFQSASISSYVFQPFIVPTTTLWPTPDATYPQLVFNYAGYYQSVDALLQNVDSPQKFYEALAAGLAARLAQKFAIDRYPTLQSLADQAYASVARLDEENVPARFQPNWISYT